MARVEESIDIGRPCEEVFAYVSSLDHWKEWAHLVIDLPQASPGPLREGSTFTVINRFLGRTLETTYTVTASEPPRRLVARSTSGPAPVTFTYTCAPIAGGTRFTAVWDFAPDNLFRLAAPLVAAAAQRQEVKNLASLKERLETPA